MRNDHARAARDGAHIVSAFVGGRGLRCAKGRVREPSWLPGRTRGRSGEARLSRSAAKGFAEGLDGLKRRLSVEERAEQRKIQVREEGAAVCLHVPLLAQHVDLDP